MRMRRTAVAALLAAGIVVPTVSTAAVAFAHPAATSAAHRDSPKPSRTGKPVRTKFAADGKVTAVDAAAGTVTLRVKGGTKDVRKRTITVTVGTASVVVNGRGATPAAITVGAKITVTGTRSAGIYTAARVRVTQKSRHVTPRPTPTVDPTPTVTPSPTPTVDPTPTVTPTDPAPDEDDPSVDPTPTGPAPDDDPTGDPEDEFFDDLSA